MRCISAKPFPVPNGSEIIAIPGGDFETDGKIPTGWDAQKGQVVAANDAPQGKAYYKIEAIAGTTLRTPRIPAKPGKPYFISLWLKCPAEHYASVTFGSEERLPSTSVDTCYIPGTGNQWKHVGIYFWMPVPARTVQFHIAPRGEPEQPGQSICVDDLQLRSASNEEMAEAYEAERSHLPPYNVAPQPGDGRNLALSVAKWEGKAGIPGKPYVIWGIGSSWTAAQEEGYGLIYDIQKNFPHAPPIEYHAHDGAGTPWTYAGDWVKQFVGAEQPDLIFTYTVGSTEGLDAMLTEIRKHTTADIIVPSIHFRPTDSMTPDNIENGYVSWAKIREICEKHHAEFVEHRRDLAEYFKVTGLKPDDLLIDHVHQNQHGRIRVWDDVMKHITDPKQFTYDSASLERVIPVNPPMDTATEKVTLHGKWTTGKTPVRSVQGGDKITVHFTGNRIDLIGHRTAGGGTAKVFIDGTPAEQAPVFQGNYIRAIPKIYPKEKIRAQPGDVAPQAANLLSHLVPQRWTITMVDDNGNYEIVGSVTGPDGKGNAAQPFVSNSGQIGIDPEMWRNNVLKNKEQSPGQPPVFGNGTDDKFVFDVYRCAVGSVSFAGDKPELFSVPLVQSLPNQEHTLEMVTNGDGGVDIESFYVFSPMEK